MSVARGFNLICSSSGDDISNVRFHGAGLARAYCCFWKRSCCCSWRSTREGACGTSPTTCILNFFAAVVTGSSTADCGGGSSSESSGSSAKSEIRRRRLVTLRGSTFKSGSWEAYSEPSNASSGRIDAVPLRRAHPHCGTLSMPLYSRLWRFPPRTLSGSSCSSDPNARRGSKPPMAHVLQEAQLCCGFLPKFLILNVS